MGKKSKPDQVSTSQSSGSSSSQFDQKTREELEKEESSFGQTFQNELLNLLEKQFQQQTGTTTPQATAREEDLLSQFAGASGVGFGQNLQARQGLLGLINPLTQGQALPGMFSSIGQGIPEDIQKSIIDKSLNDIAPRFEQLGIGSSGPAMQLSANLARDVRLQSALETNRQREMLLNLGASLPLAFQSPILQEQGMFGGQLAGLRPVTTQATGELSGQRTGETIGSQIQLLSSLARALSQGQASGTQSGSFSQMGSGTNTMNNIFRNAFMQSLGNTLGSPRFSSGPVSFGG